MTTRSLISLVLLGAVACGGLRAARPRSTHAIASVEIAYGAALGDDNRRTLDVLEAKKKLGEAIFDSFASDGPLKLKVTITKMKVGYWGPGKMTLVGAMLDPAGKTVSSTVAEGSTDWGIKGGSAERKLWMAAQGAIDSLAGAL